MTGRSQRPSKKAVLAAATLAVLGAALAMSCSSKNDESKVTPCANGVECGASCTPTAGCAAGQYCGSDSKCTADCVPGDGRCGAGKMCNATGKCVGGLIIDAGNGSGGGDGDGGVIDGDSCVKLDVTFTKQIPTVVMLVDQSGSMNARFGMGNRWNVLRDALVAPGSGIISTLQSEVRFGLALYTSDDGYGTAEPKKICPIITEVPPALDNFATISAAYLPNAWRPDGDTPTGESVDAAVKILAGVTEPGPKVIVLATDGEPDSCTDPDPNNAAGREAARQVSVTAVTNAFQAQVTTFVISVGNEVGEEHLRAVANAGQGLAVDVDQTNRFYRANNQADLEMAFASIVGGVRSCVLALNGSVNLAEASQGTVLLDGMPIKYNDPDGWKLNSSTVLELTGAACTAIKTGDHSIKIDFPCGVIVPIVPK